MTQERLSRGTRAARDRVVGRRARSARATLVAATILTVALVAGLSDEAGAAQEAIAGEGGSEVDAGEIVRLAETLFGGIPERGNAHLVVPDRDAAVYFAFFIADWVDLWELRVFRIPMASVVGVDEHLAAGDHAAAFTAVLAGVDRNAPSVADVGLDGISDAGHPIGGGILRDEYDRIHFFSPAQADRVYRRWLRRANALLGR
jgi:hypothetical protein